MHWAVPLRRHDIHCRAPAGAHTAAFPRRREGCTSSNNASGTHAPGLARAQHAAPAYPVHTPASQMRAPWQSVSSTHEVCAFGP